MRNEQDIQYLKDIVNVLKELVDQPQTGNCAWNVQLTTYLTYMQEWIQRVDGGG